MAYKRTITVMFSMLVAVPMLSVYAGSPVKTEDVASAEDLTTEAKAKITALDDALATEKSFTVAKKKVIPQAAGVLACLAQALAEHSDHAKVNVAAPDLRDAAISITAAESYADAQKGLENAKQAMDGKSSGAVVEFDWQNLIGLDPLMHEVNARNSKIRRTTRRIKDPAEESLDPMTLAVLALATHAHTETIDSKEDIENWQQMSLDLQKQMSEIAAAIKAKDADKAKDLHRESSKTCAACHKEFRDK